MKALVTGAAGFIGSYLTESLLNRGYEVTCLVRPTTSLSWIEHLNPDLIRSDLADAEGYADRLGDFDYIFHLAGATKARSEQEFFRANELCTHVLAGAAAARCTRLKRFVQLSSLAAAGPSRDGTPVCEESPPRPVSWYGQSKLAGERAALELADRLPVTVLRPPAVYGPRDTDFFVIFRMIKKGFFPSWGTCNYSLLYVEDLVRGIIAAAESESAAGKTFFLADDMVYTSDEIAEEIARALGERPIRVRLPGSLLPVLAFVGEKISKKGIINRDRIQDFRYSSWTCDGTKARNEFGFSSTITLREGIKWTADWYRIHRWL